MLQYLTLTQTCRDGNRMWTGLWDGPAAGPDSDLQLLGC